jgi:prevent-host-death family protein
MPKEITAINLRRKLGEILDAVANQRERFLIKRSGIPAAILLSVPDYEDLQDLIDTWYEQQDRTFQQSLADARRDIDAGKVATIDDLRRLDAQVHRRVLAALDALQANPYQGQHLTDVPMGQWRIRVGDYRIRYDIEGSRVLLYRVRHRKDFTESSTPDFLLWSDHHGQENQHTNDAGDSAARCAAATLRVMREHGESDAHGLL